MISVIPVMLFINTINADIISNKRQRIIIIRLAGLSLFALINLLFRLDLMFTSEGGIIKATLLFLILYMPSFFIGYISKNYMFFKLFKAADKEYRSLYIYLLVGVIILYSTELIQIISIVHGIRNGRLLSYIFTIGIFILHICVLIFTTRFIKIRLSYLQSNECIIREKKKELSALINRETYELYEKILTKIEVEKLYTNPNLTLDNLALKVHTNKVIVSRTINECFGENFNVFINTFRVEEMIQQINKDRSEKSILQIGFDAVFNSRSSIHRIFQNITKMSPMDYRKKIKNINTENELGTQELLMNII